MARKQSGMDDDWWTVTAIHEAAHGIVAFALGCHPVEVRLDKRAKNRGSSLAGVCIATHEKSYYGKVSGLLVTNAPFVAHQYECLPSGNKGDIHERDDCQHKFAELIGGWDANLFAKCIDAPLLSFFGDSDVQASTLVLARLLYAQNKVTLKQVNHWVDKLAISQKPCEVLQECCLRVAEAVAK